jgi:hypothetical protein
MRWTVVIAGALVPAPLAAELCADVRAVPLLARGTAEPLQATDGAPAHWSWLWRALGGSGAPVSAPYFIPGRPDLRRSDVPEDKAQLWFCDPVHFAVGLDDVQVQGLAAPLTEAESGSLYELAADAAQTCGATLIASEARWLLRPESPWTLDTVPLDAALGQSVRQLWPHGADARHWRKLLTEVQMRWHEHPVNEARAQRGAAVVNGLWLHGGGTYAPLPPARWQAAVGDDPVLHGWLHATGAEPAACIVNDAPLPRTAAALVLDDRLWPSHLAQDWPAWQRAFDTTATRLQTLSAHAYAQGAQAVEVVLCGQRSTRTCTLRPSDRWRFWRDTQLAQLLAEHLA